ncbi:hypothetical protein BT69DRAFT_1263270 [Atractiella rhizophila]|nr:hypothetical protein BT69DRAFT_1263270 [Atractiella rhizophila]
MTSKLLFKSISAHMQGEGGKPQTAVTDWIERLCSSSYDENSLDSLPDLVDVIDIQPESGPTEASRALRKKLKYGSKEQQLRALTLLRALVENCSRHFKLHFGDQQLLQRIKEMARDSTTDPKVKKKLMVILAGWEKDFANETDYRLKTLAGLWKECGGVKKPPPPTPEQLVEQAIAREKREKELEDRRLSVERAREEQERQRRERLEREREELERKRQEKEDKKKKSSTKPSVKREPFNLEKEKPKVMETIAVGTQGANTLINSLRHVNIHTSSPQTDPAVQQALTSVKASRKQIVRYIQLVAQNPSSDPKGEFVGTLISTNEKIIEALEAYDRWGTEEMTAEEAESVTKGMKDVDLSSVSRTKGKELERLQEKQRVRVGAHLKRRETMDELSSPTSASAGGVHPDLQDLSFDDRGLQQPIQPGAKSYNRNSFDPGLSDYSDHTDSSDEESHNRATGSNNIKGYQQYLDEHDKKKGLLDDDDDPFADPEDDLVGTPGIPNRKLSWAEI